MTRKEKLVEDVLVRVRSVGGSRTLALVPIPTSGVVELWMSPTTVVKLVVSASGNTGIAVTAELEQDGKSGETVDLWNSFDRLGILSPKGE